MAVDRPKTQGKAMEKSGFGWFGSQISGFHGMFQMFGWKFRIEAMGNGFGNISSIRSLESKPFLMGVD